MHAQRVLTMCPTATDYGLRTMYYVLTACLRRAYFLTHSPTPSHQSTRTSRLTRSRRAPSGTTWARVNSWSGYGTAPSSARLTLSQTTPLMLPLCHRFASPALLRTPNPNLDPSPNPHQAPSSASTPSAASPRVDRTRAGYGYAPTAPTRSLTLPRSLTPNPNPNPEP